MDQVDRIIAQWQAERPKLETGPMALFGRLQRIADHLALEMEQLHARHGLTSAGFDVLATLRRAGKDARLTPSELMASTMVTSGTMTNRLDRLEAAGFISRHRNPEDGRGFKVELTQKGFEVIEQAVEEHVALQASLLVSLDPSDQAKLGALLTTWLAALE